MIALFSGTIEGRKIIKELSEEDLKVTVFTATSYGSSLISEKDNVKTKSGSLTRKEIEEVLKEIEVEKIVDATHPYAENISRNLIEVSKNLNIPYFRYERRGININKNDKNILFSNYKKIIDYLKDNNGNVLLTIGSKNLKKFADEIDNKRIYLRILPFPKLIQEALDMGIELKKIIGIQGPFNKEFNKALIKSYEIKYIVTKNSGVEGGIIEKIEAAKEMGIKVLILDKPRINYPNKYESIKKLIISIK